MVQLEFVQTLVCSKLSSVSNWTGSCLQAKACREGAKTKFGVVCGNRYFIHHGNGAMLVHYTTVVIVGKSR